jgi:hypothetical protein
LDPVARCKGRECAGSDKTAFLAGPEKKDLEKGRDRDKIKVRISNGVVFADKPAGKEIPCGFETGKKSLPQL